MVVAAVGHWEASCVAATARDGNVVGNLGGSAADAGGERSRAKLRSRCSRRPVGAVRRSGSSCARALMEPPARPPTHRVRPPAPVPLTSRDDPRPERFHAGPRVNRWEFAHGLTRTEGHGQNLSPDSACVTSVGQRPRLRTRPFERWCGSGRRGAPADLSSSRPRCLTAGGSGSNMRAKQPQPLETRDRPSQAPCGRWSSGWTTERTQFPDQRRPQVHGCGRRGGPRSATAKPGLLGVAAQGPGGRFDRRWAAPAELRVSTRDRGAAA